ncbi:hypothetical protein [Sphaerotilus microaerophilus]|jgi:hypothetical protein|uniref:Uncharacterized protein n=1 Tax=Sphaerotilus microaerophilus TaxID=2914710 RepID=A0ABM7YQS1_9BURK|nr:hypothetical protein [Sphaerotilus sp. FB-5]BDI06900.1 hypothetical protein CATMQ487_38700 [Sphaerotilus sp. FB-5]
MSLLRLTQVFQRSNAGQALLWDCDVQPSEQARILMRLTGFTPLSRLLDPQHDPQWLLGVVERLASQGLVELVDDLADDAPSSTWGELALALPN